MLLNEIRIELADAINSVCYCIAHTTNLIHQHIPRRLSETNLQRTSLDGWIFRSFSLNRTTIHLK
ncbi:hypothetical protein NMYAN_10443 [Nitrosomonas nitrosa]|uniref:Uncharacterized protein n=1 Tax=Nitrosomonas nitrosa TaxID=52442 RepID=A0A8H9DA57_9PROT|nr:hypothetical protein NMYAN_10443 [Nitrosomonas nitrosa]